MTTRYYKLPGSNEYVTWDYLHNTLGYSTSATETVGYKSVVNWGTGAGTGYCTDTTDYEAEWFVQGETGWAGLNGLAWEYNVYPGSAEDIRVERSGTESNAASMTFDGVEYWLVETEIGDAWWPRSRWEQQGWAIVEDHVYDFILVDSTTGRITYGVENLTEIEFAPTGYFLIDEGNEIVFVEQSPFPVVCIDEGARTPESIAPDAGFDTGLPYYASKLYIVTTDDGQNETLYGWEASEAVEPVSFPTVSINDDFGGSNWLYLTLSENVQMNEGSVLAPTETYSYDSTKAYAVVFWQNVYGTNTGSADVGVVDDNGTLKLKNVSTSQIYIKCARVAVCSDSTVGKTIVYDANGDNHNAFVFDMSGTPYYYVLDGVQTDWTDDLANIGYTKTVPVSKAGDYGSSNLLTATTSASSRTLSAGSTGAPYISGTTGNGTYKYSRSYATYYGYETNGGNKIDPTRLGWLKGSGVSTLYWKNISASSLRISWAVVALCSNPCADVVPVYNSSLVAYNAFKYTENGTDYYYVLDETQTDWTDDLSSIGYHV